MIWRGNIHKGLSSMLLKDSYCLFPNSGFPNKTCSYQIIQEQKGKENEFCKGTYLTRESAVASVFDALDQRKAVL
ncbi:hypothetical protein IMSAGC018_00875 [Lachnospiraceae bacterium]|nr:hypothetical protein IMSAGC018_00875 [Lachnospiraceae bacterium]